LEKKSKELGQKNQELASQFAERKLDMELKINEAV
jgi:hypothetical protein